MAEDQDPHAMPPPEGPPVNGAPFGGDEDVQEDLEWPIGFMVVVGLTALYVIWRLIQMVGRLFDVAA